MTNIFPTNYTLKATPVDADLLFIADSADGNNSKKITVGSMTSAIADGVINDSASASTTTYSSTKIIALNDAQDTTISGLSSSKLDKNGQLRTGNGAWKVTYNNGSGNETEVSLGSSGQVLVSNGATSAPTFQSVTADVNGQTEDTVGDMDADFVLAYDTSAGANRKQKISVYRATSGDITTGTSTTKFITVAQQVAFGASASGTTTKNAADASTTQTIAHGLGKVPRFVRLTCRSINNSTNPGNFCEANSVYNGTTQSSQSVYNDNGTIVCDSTFTLNTATGASSNYQRGVITVDSTNISIAWTKTGSATGTYQILWEAR